MGTPDEHLLLDAGDGRRLERFGSRTVDRPSPVATGRLDPAAGWATADLVFDRESGWRSPGRDAGFAGSSWTMALEGLLLELRPAAGGQVGCFPEHRPGWSWVAERVRERVGAGGSPPQVLNLFAYTGAATLAAAGAGAAVAHVDGARAAVDWARRNARLSRLDDRPIRWLVDDAPAFAARELRRGMRYDGIVLDPPSYGHGGRRAWRIGRDLGDLLAACAALLDQTSPFVLLTAHTPGFDPLRLAELLATALGVAERQVEAAPLELRAPTGATLALGAAARWSGG